MSLPSPLLPSDARVTAAAFRQRYASGEVGVLSLDAGACILDANAVFCAQTNYPLDALRGRALASLGNPDVAHLNRSAVLRLLRRGHLRRVDLPLRSQDGVTLYFDFLRIGRLVDHAWMIECLPCSPGEPGLLSISPETADAGSTAPTPLAANRHGVLHGAEFEVIASQEIARTRDCGRPLSLLSIGIDRIGHLLDALHPDQARVSDIPLSLRAFEQTCASQLRGSDVVGRVDETVFVALLPGVTTRGALSAAERLRVAIAAMDAPTSRGRWRRLTVSIGAVTTRTGRTSYQALRSRADAKRDDARNSGGNRVYA